jgi:hypothetical protein
MATLSDRGPRAGPSLAKTRGERLVRVRVVTALRASDGRFREMFEAADVVSEGSVRMTDGDLTWFGTTSLVLAWPEDVRSADARDFVAALAAQDPHVRVRALRVAHREASLRAPAPLGRAVCEMRAFVTTEGLRIDVDVEAPLTLPSRAVTHGRGPTG